MAGGLLAAALGKPTTVDEEEEEDLETEEGDELSSFSEFADDAYNAVKSGDRKAFASALKAAVKACYADEG